MKKIAIALILLSASLSFSQIKGNAKTISRQNVMSLEELGNANYMQPVEKFRRQQLVPNAIIDIDVKALYNAVADSYTAVFNVVQIGKTSNETEQLMSERMTALKQELFANGITKDNIVTDVISFVPVYETVVERKLFSKKYNEVPIGFELQQNINIRFTDANQFEKILSSCAKSEVYNLVKVDYFINNIEDVYKTLREKILLTLKEKQQFYNDLGFDLSLYDPKIADTQYCLYPREFYKNYQAFNSISMEVIKKNKGVLKAKKQVSYYYDALSFGEYDVVINPSILEPVIQIGMEVKLYYTPKPKEQKPKEKQVVKNRFFLISENGSLTTKELKLEN